MCKTDTQQILAWTGERYIPGCTGKIVLEHLHRYLLAQKLIEGKIVLDIACGEGYGSNLLAEMAAQVTGVDISEVAVAHAQSKYVRQNLSFIHGSCTAVPMPDASVDVIVSFETIEHHDQHEEMMREFCRVLRPEGLIVISSPDKYEHCDFPNYVNEFHIKELYVKEFQALLRRYFQQVTLYGQRVHYSSIITPLVISSTPFCSYELDDEALRCSPGLPRPLFIIALATNGHSLPLDISFCYSLALDQEMEKLPHLLSEAQFLNQSVAANCDAQLEAVNNELHHLRGQIRAIYGSHSWRLTAPLRALSTLCKQRWSR